MQKTPSVVAPHPIPPGLEATACPVMNPANNPTARLGGLKDKSEVEDAVEGYEKYHTSFGGKVEDRKNFYSDMVNKYYDLATSFYEFGW
eukprot:1188029-Prorocentrum_minimum.AAC.4